ncbi:MarR family winged helix-turn-helix transcriptional regulator [Mangrovicella endophytica]|uniref:MarR family winged helix-turn-helix transcriptional regulator n=1 Tax=Mangrovicella endophytica TaxID=2066697 RepID=UPI000C9E35CC|nr:MarR family transcriptional regulator [Mangrovicella endophytica]
MTTPTDDQIETLGAALDTFVRRFKLADAVRADKPLNEVDTQTLLYVRDHPACGPTDVARFLAVPVTTISSATDRLAKRGLLERRRVEGDRRAVALGLSDAGTAHLAAYEEAHRDLYRFMLQRLSPAERDSFISMIAKIAYNED